MEKDWQYSASVDSNGKTLNGGNYYKFHLPPEIPACTFWSVIVYDNQTHLIIHTDQQWPSVHSNCKKLIFNEDGSVDIFFGPEFPAGKEYNWIKTIPRKRWYAVLRLYDLKESDPAGWKPGEITEI